MGVKVRHLQSLPHHIIRMVAKSGGNYYLPMTSYLETKNNPGPRNDLPGPLCFSERIAVHPLSGTSVSVYADQSLETIKKTRQVITTILSTTPSSEVASS